MRTHAVPLGGYPQHVGHKLFLQGSAEVVHVIWDGVDNRLEVGPLEEEEIVSWVVVCDTCGYAIDVSPTITGPL